MSDVNFSQMKINKVDAIKIFDLVFDVRFDIPSKTLDTRFFPTQSAFTCSKLTTENIEQGVRYVQS